MNQCDMKTGPCSCGAWHQDEPVSEQPQAGQWTSGPPTAPGWYWWRYKVYHPNGDVVEKEFPVYEACKTTYFAVDGEWWSEPIEEPPR